jgi:tetratricopeptide (TPR) repeat protein
VQRLFQKIDGRLRQFIGQRDALLLVVICRDEETAFLLKTTQAIDESSADVFWMFAEDFVDPQAYVDALVGSFRTRVEMLNTKLTEAGEPPWPALPPRLVDVRTRPSARMRVLLMYARRRIPNLEKGRLVAVLTPFKIENPLGWRAFLRELTEHDPAAPWCHHLRIIARERPGVVLPERAGELRERADLASFRSTEVYPIDLGADALAAAVQEDIADPELPIADRAQALLTAAMLDYAHQRYRAAMEKYRLLRDLYAHLGLEPMLALVLNGMGEVLARTGNRAQAIEHFEMAITPAANSASYAVLLNVSLNLANVYLAAKEWAKAAEHYAAAESLATAMLNAQVKLACLENIGVCRAQLRDWGGAHQAWRVGATLASTLREADAQKRLLTRLRKLYDAANMRDHLRSVEQELRGVR